MEQMFIDLYCFDCNHLEFNINIDLVMKYVFPS